MLRIMLVLGLLVLVPAVIMFWRTRDRVVVDPSSVSEKIVGPSRPVGTSTLSHGGPPRAGRPAAPDRVVEAPASDRDPRR